MSDFVDLTRGKKGFRHESDYQRQNRENTQSALATGRGNAVSPDPNSLSKAPQYGSLHAQLAEASKLVDDIILKNYLSKLTDLEVIPLDDSLKQIGQIRLFKITEMVYQREEYATYKFASVFSAVQNLNCGIFIIADSDGRKTDFYMGVRSFDNKRTTKSLKATLENALCGQFPGVKTKDLLDPEAEKFLAGICSKNITSVSCVAQNKDEDFKENDSFLQGLEKLVLAMQGQEYTAVILAKSTSSDQLAEIRKAYESIYTSISPFANMQVSYSTNSAITISDALSQGSTTGTSHSTNQSSQTGHSTTRNTSTNASDTKADTKITAVKSIGSVALGVASLVTAPLTGGTSLVAAGGLIAASAGLSALNPKTTTNGSSESESYTENVSETTGESYATNQSESSTQTQTWGQSTGTSDNMQLSMQNKTLTNILERIDLQLKRLNECESLGMWECAAYFLSDSQETAEMAAGTYKAIMKGEKSGIETSAINFWGRQHAKQLPMICEYITNFIHPVFQYSSEHTALPVTASSLVSSNELAIHMGLPRRSVCGFPIIEHAEFGKEVVQYHTQDPSNGIVLGEISGIGSHTGTKVPLGLDSLAMHTFITGSTGSGKSNTVYQMLDKLSRQDIRFLVIEPAKGEYKNVFGGRKDVSVYGTNAKKTLLLQLNPFSFPDDIHVLEHIDRLVEIFNACWPMYAAMPAVLKDVIEQAYRHKGWDLTASYSVTGEFPTFYDLKNELPIIMEQSAYSADTKGDYIGALVTRVNSLTNGINGQIFCSSVELPVKKLFDQNVIIDISRVGSMETKSLLMGILVMKLQEYRMSSGIMNAPLRHITVLEEAHNLLRRTSDAQSQESANLQGKSVEMIANAIAEMRTYGEGFIIADQAPGLMDPSVIRNTNTKIIMRLPDESDRELVGKAASLNDEQIAELAKLPLGVAAVYQNNWLEPVLCKIAYFKDVCPYTFHPASAPEYLTHFFHDLFHLTDDRLLSEKEREQVEHWVDHLNNTTETKRLLREALKGNHLSANDQGIIAYNLFEGKQLMAILEKETDEKKAMEQVEMQIACMNGIHDMALVKHIKDALLRMIFREFETPVLRNRFIPYMQKGGTY